MSGHGGHNVDDGPSAKRFVSGMELGLDPEIAAFVTANCSPFTHPNQMDVNPKVPDTKIRALTGYAYLEARFQIPSISITQGNVTNGEQQIIMNANPLAALPIVWSQAEKLSTDETKYGNSGVTDPSVWAKRYEDVGLSNLMAQCKTLGSVSRKHRIVGAGLRVIPTTSTTTVDRGLIEGGHFTTSESVQQTNDLTSYSNGTAAGIRYLKATTDPATPNFETDDHDNVVGGRPFYPVQAGYLGQYLMSDDLEKCRASILEARSSDKYGRSSTEQGMSVRWLPTDNWDFVKTINHHVVGISDMRYGHGVHTQSPASNTVAQTASTSRWIAGTYFLQEAGKPAACVISHDNIYQNETRPSQKRDSYDICSYPVPEAVTNLGGSHICDPESNLCTFQKRVNSTANAALTPGTQNSEYQGIFYAIDPEVYKYDYVHVGNTKMMGYTDDEQNFQNSMYIDCTGMTDGTMLDVTVVWHVEFIPKEFHLNPGRSSPVTMDWLALEATISDPEQFPVVVQGHSFFSSLKKAIKGAWKFFKKLAPTIGGVLSAMPDARAKAAGAGISMAGDIANRF